MKKGKLNINHIIGNRYQIISELGKGGMSTVYLASDIKLPGKLWAVKEGSGYSKDMSNFMAEAEVLVQLDHPYLPKVVDFFPPNAEGLHYIIMDYIKGHTLQHVFEQSGQRLPISQIIKYALQLTELFEYLHHALAKPIIYRDLKPSNVMIDEQDNVRLIDFGIARHFKVGQGVDTVNIGTIGFAAPEQFESTQTDHRTDLYAIGALLYYLISGGQYYYTKQQPLRQIKADTPEHLAKVVDRLLMQSPDDRYQSAKQLKQELSQQALIATPKPAFSTEHYGDIANKLIVIGGLYPGAGATFTALTMARSLHAYRIPHAVIEHPAIVPELYHLLYGDKKAPRSYNFYAEQISQKKPIHEDKEWHDGSTLWVPNQPKQNFSWNTSDNYKLIHATRRSLNLVDISNQWQALAIEDLCWNADLIVCVVDTYPTRIHLAETELLLKSLEHWKKSGKKVVMVVNKDINTQDKKAWLKSLPYPPICAIPYISYEDIVGAVWRGELAQDHLHWKEKCRKAVYPLLQEIVPTYLLKDQTSKSLWSRLWKGSAISP